jgi:hypothetical protein
MFNWKLSGKIFLAEWPKLWNCSQNGIRQQTHYSKKRRFWAHTAALTANYFYCKIIQDLYLFC